MLAQRSESFVADEKSLICPCRALGWAQAPTGSIPVSRTSKSPVQRLFLGGLAGGAADTLPTAAGADTGRAGISAAGRFQWPVCPPRPGHALPK